MNIDSKTLHERLLSMVKQLHEFCVAHNISYYMLGGTALGAKRHKGFIPWDDDVDIGMPRKDYDTFISLRDELPDNLEISYYLNTKNSPMHYVKLVDKNTTLIEKFYNYLVEGLYIDIFPLDGAFKNNRKDIRRRKKIYSLFQRICWHCNTEKKKGLLRKTYKLYCGLFNLTKMHRKMEKLMTKVPCESGDSIANFLGAYKDKECVPIACFLEPTLYKFEDTELYGPKNIEQYLTCLYGDYMKLPPVEERVFKHGFAYLNLDLPYCEYKGVSTND